MATNTGMSAGDATTAFNNAFQGTFGFAPQTNVANTWVGNLTSGAFTPDEMKQQLTAYRAANPQYGANSVVNADGTFTNPAGLTTTPTTTPAATTVDTSKVNAPTTGLINADSVTPGNVATVAPATGTASTYDPTSVNVTPQMTVAGQVQGLLAADSPAMQAAKTQADQQSNARGILNSTMATQAGEQAMINEALPIAQQDAQTNTTAALANQSAQNQGGAFNAGQTQAMTGTNIASTNAGQQFNASGMNTVSLQKMQDAFQGQIANADAQTKVQLQQMQNDTQKSVANIQANYQSLIQTTATGGTMFNTTMNNINSIVSDPNMDAASKAAAINGYLSNLQTGFAAIGDVNGVNTTYKAADGTTHSLLDFTPVTTD